MISASARSRHTGSRSPPSAFTLASVWNVLDEREVELVLEAVGGEAAEPVVGVQHVGREVAVEVVRHAVAELVDDRRQLLLAEVERPGRHVHHPVPRLDLHDLGLIRARGAGEGGAVDAGLRRAPTPARARTRSSRHCRPSPVGPAATCGARGLRPVARCGKRYPSRSGIRVHVQAGRAVRPTGDEAVVHVEQRRALLGRRASGRGRSRRGPRCR